MKLLFKIFLGGCLCISLLWASAKPPEWFTQEKIGKLPCKLACFYHQLVLIATKQMNFFSVLKQLLPGLTLSATQSIRTKRLLKHLANFYNSKNQQILASLLSFL